jgi:2-dehydropantoate 2-reductase
MTEHRIAIVGAGALGLLLGGRLAEAGVPAVLATRTEEQAERLRREGIALRDGQSGAVRRIAAAAEPIGRMPSGAESLIVLTVKQTAIGPQLLSTLARISRADAAVAAFQNGIGHLEKLAGALPGRTLLAAVTTEAALRTGDCAVSHTGRGRTWIGPAPLDEADARSAAEAESPMPEAARRLETALKQAGFSVILSNRLKERMMRKLLVNAVVNPLTALLRVANGELLAAPERVALARALFDETVRVLSRWGLPSDPDPLWDELQAVCASTAHNRSSMLQDVLAGRPVEIDAINGEIVRLAGRAGEAAPWNEAVTALLKAMNQP